MSNSGYQPGSAKLEVVRPALRTGVTAETPTEKRVEAKKSIVLIGLALKAPWAVWDWLSFKF